MAHEHANLCGAIIDPAAKRAFRASLRIKSYGDLPRQSGEGKQRLLYLAQRQVYGRDFEESQSIGSCVGKAIQRAILTLWCVRIALGGKKEKFPGVPAAEVPYALGRWEIGRGRLGSGDGCVVSWALKGVMEYGILLRQKYPGYDLTTNSAKREKEWGRTGVPDELEPIARLSPVRAAVPIRTVAQMRDAIYNLEPVFGGSDSIPENGARRDSEGIINLSARGGHATLCTGFDDTDGNLKFWYDNASWPAVPGPQPFDCPRCGGFVYAKRQQQMLNEGEWYALSDMWTMPDQVEEIDPFVMG